MQQVSKGKGEVGLGQDEEETEGCWVEKGWRVGGTGEPDLTRPPEQAPCHCRGGEGQKMDKYC